MLVHTGSPESQFWSPIPYTTYNSFLPVLLFYPEGGDSRLLQRLVPIYQTTRRQASEANLNFKNENKNDQPDVSDSK
jgi:hypothetical protein